jgi:tetratricopeptide (TPR) repeat protein
LRPAFASGSRAGDLPHRRFDVVNPPAAVREPNRRSVAGIALCLSAVGWLVFGQTLRHDFVNFDDEVYVYQNPKITAGLSLNSVLWAFTHPHARNWHPLSTLTHMLDCQFFGLNPAGHHFTNVLLHSASAALLFIGLRAMTQRLWPSAFVAALFAVHPLHVESVAWVAERKDVLSAFFFALTLAAYSRYTRGSGRYVWVIVSFALGLMSKPMLVTTPLVLLLLDFWPLRRLQLGRCLLIEKLPLLALAAASCVATLIAQSGTGSIAPLPLSWRLKNATITPIVYLAQMCWPVDLAPFYPCQAGGPSLVQSCAAGALLVVVSLAAFSFRKTQPWLITGWCWYLIMLLPVIGIVQIGLQSHADRYTYLPQIGVYIALTWMIASAVRSPVLLASGAAAVLIVLAALSFRQTQFWRDSRTLWTHAAAVTAENEVAENNLGMLDAHDGKLDRAVEHYERAIQIQTARGATRYDLTVALAENNLATAFARKGNIDDAVAHYTRALDLRPDYADAFYNLGTLLLQEGKLNDAIDAFRAVIRLRPEDAPAHASLGDALHAKRAETEARGEYEAGLQLAPDAPWAIYSLAWLLATSSDEHVRDGERAAEIAKRGLQGRGAENPAMLRAFAAACATQGRFDEAIDVAERAVQFAVARDDGAAAQTIKADADLYREHVPLRDVGVSR